MTLHSTLRAFAWLIRDTFRQAIETRIFWLMLGLSALAVALCLSVGVEGGAELHRPGERADFLPRSSGKADREKAARDGVDFPSGSLTLAFGAFRIPLERDTRDAVHFLHLILAGGVADTAGLLLALVWTAGFLPAFLAPRSVTVLLAKPVPRAVLLVGKALGVLTFVAFQAIFFVVGTWLALGVRTGIWDVSYLWVIPILVFQFAVFFSVSAWIAAHRRRTVACLLGTLLFWLLCWGMNYGRHAVVALPDLAGNMSPLSPWLGAAVEAGYWVLPKPADMSMILTQALDSGRHFAAVPAFEAVRRLHRFHPILSVASSLLAAAFILTAAARRLETIDY
jgi:ABC-type transport system involved in multi-copper enzyme maturation permease subunit